MGNRKVVRAVRPRVCTVCRRTISPGDRYVRSVRMDVHGVFSIEKICLYHGTDPEVEMTSEELAMVLYGPDVEVTDIPYDGESPVPDPGDAESYKDMDPDTGSFPKNPFEDGIGPQ
jgi:hypothetical protein